MYSALLLLLTIVPIFVLGTLLVWVHKSGRKLWTVILGLTLFHELVLIVFPVWHSVFTDYSQERLMMASPKPIDLVVVMLGEAIFVTMFGIGFGIRRRRKMTVPVNRLIDKRLTRTDMLFLVTLTAFGMFIYLGDFISTPPSFQKYVAKVGGAFSTSFTGLIYAWSKAILWFPSLVACALVVTRFKNKRYPIWLSWMGAITLISLLLTGVTSGLRGRITWAISLLVISGYLKGQKRLIYAGLVFFVLLIPIFSILPGVVRSISYSVAEHGGSRIDLSKKVFRKLKQSRNNKVDLIDFGSNFLADASWRAQGPRNSTVLYKLFDEGNIPGFTPYIGAILFPLPRAIWPGKPIIGSSDGTTPGVAMYTVMRIGHGLSYHVMGPCLASAHAYWELGWAGILIYGLITGLFWNLILTWCDKIGGPLSIVIALSFSATLLIDGFLTMFAPLYSIITSFWKVFIPVIVIYIVAYIMAGGWKKKRLFNSYHKKR